MAQHALMSDEYLGRVHDMASADAAMKEWREKVIRTLKGQAAELLSLVAEAEPLDDLEPFDRIAVGSWVKVCGEWCEVEQKSVDHDMFGNRTVERLLVAEQGQPAWWYDLAPGERLPIESVL